MIAYPLGLLLGMLGLEAGAALVQRYPDLVAAPSLRPRLPTWLPRLRR